MMFISFHKRIYRALGSTDIKNYKAVSYDKMTVVLVEAVKELMAGMKNLSRGMRTKKRA